MRCVLGAGVFLIAVMAGQGAEAGAYCAVYSDGAVNCDFPSMWSCRASISGVGGNCGINPREYGYFPEPRRRRAYRETPPCRVYLGFGRWTDCY